jgi:hypothetical protein
VIHVGVFMRRIKDLYRSLLRVFFADVPVSLYRLLLFGLVTYSIFPIFFYPDMLFYKIYYYISYLTISILLICAILYFPMKAYIRTYYTNIQTKDIRTKNIQAKRDNKKNTKHLAIILVRYKIIYKTLFYLLTNFKKFFMILNQNHIPYNVYVIDTKEDFIKIITDKNVRALFIFGHGRRHGLKIGNEIWPYYNVPQAKNITYVGQFHCNHESGKSLYEHLGCDGVLIKGVTLSYDINEYIDSKKYISILKKILS